MSDCCNGIGCPICVRFVTVPANPDQDGGPYNVALNTPNGGVFRVTDTTSGESFEVDLNQMIEFIDWTNLGPQACQDIFQCILDNGTTEQFTQLLQTFDFTQLTAEQCEAINGCCEVAPLPRTVINLNGATAGVDVLQDTGNAVDPFQQVLTEAEFDAFLAGANLVSTGTQLTLDPPNVAGPSDATQISFWVTVPDGESRTISWSVNASSGAVDLDRCGCGENERIGFFSQNIGDPVGVLSAVIPGGVHLVTVSTLDHNGGNISFDYTGDPIDFYAPSSGQPTVEIVELFFQCDGTFQDADGNTVPNTGTPGAGACGTGEPIKASQIIDPQNLMTTSGGQLTVNAGDTADVGDASNGTADVALGETIHFHSSDDSVDVGVTEGSAIVDLRAHKTIAVGCAVRELALAFDSGFVDGLHRVPMPGGNGFATIDITGAPNLDQNVASNFLTSNAADTHPVTIRFDTPVVNPVLRMNDIDLGPETVGNFTVNGDAQTPVVAGAGTQGNPNGPWSSNQNGVTQSFAFTGEVSEITFEYTANGAGIAVLLLSVAAGFSVPTYTCQSPDGVEQVLFRDDDTAVPAGDVVPCPVAAGQLPDGIDTFGTVGSPEFTAVVTTNGVTVPVGGFFVAFPDGTTWAAPAGGSVNPVDLISAEEGNTLRVGDDGLLYADPNIETCWIESEANENDNQIGAWNQTSTDALLDPAGPEFSHVAEFDADQITVSVRLNGPNSPFGPTPAPTAPTDLTITLVNTTTGETDTATATITPALMAGQAFVEVPFVLALPGTSAGDALTIDIVHGPELGLRTNVFGQVGGNGNTDPQNWSATGWNVVDVNRSQVAHRMVYETITEHQVEVSDDGEGPKWIEFDSNGDPTEIADPLLAGWTRCGDETTSDYVQTSVRCFEDPMFFDLIEALANSGGNSTGAIANAQSPDLTWTPTVDSAIAQVSLNVAGGSAGDTITVTATNLATSVTETTTITLDGVAALGDLEVGTFPNEIPFSAGDVIEVDVTFSNDTMTWRNQDANSQAAELAWLPGVGAINDPGIGFIENVPEVRTVAVYTDKNGVGPTMQFDITDGSLVMLDEIPADWAECPALSDAQEVAVLALIEQNGGASTVEAEVKKGQINLGPDDSGNPLLTPSGPSVTVNSAFFATTGYWIPEFPPGLRDQYVYEGTIHGVATGGSNGVIVMVDAAAPSAEFGRIVVDGDGPFAGSIMMRLGSTAPAGLAFKVSSGTVNLVGADTFITFEEIGT